MHKHEETQNYLPQVDSFQHWLSAWPISYHPVAYHLDQHKPDNTIYNDNLTTAFSSRVNFF